MNPTLSSFILGSKGFGPRDPGTQELRVSEIQGPRREQRPVCPIETLQPPTLIFRTSIITITVIIVTFEARLILFYVRVCVCTPVTCVQVPWETA